MHLEYQKRRGSRRRTLVILIFVALGCGAAGLVATFRKVADPLKAKIALLRTQRQCLNFTDRYGKTSKSSRSVIDYVFSKSHGILLATWEKSLATIAIYIRVETAVPKYCVTLMKPTENNIACAIAPRKCVKVNVTSHYMQ